MPVLPVPNWEIDVAANGAVTVKQNGTLVNNVQNVAVEFRELGAANGRTASQSIAVRVDVLDTAEQSRRTALLNVCVGNDAASATAYDSEVTKYPSVQVLKSKPGDTVFIAMANSVLQTMTDSPEPDPSEIV